MRGAVPSGLPASTCAAPADALGAALRASLGDRLTALPGALSEVDVVLDCALPGRGGPLPREGAPRRAFCAAASWNLRPPRTRAFPAAVAAWPLPSLWFERARFEVSRQFGREIALPPDLEAAVHEPALRACPMTRDDQEPR